MFIDSKKKKELRGLKQSGTRTELKMSKKKTQQVSKDKLLKSGVTQNDTKVWLLEEKI